MAKKRICVDVESEVLEVLKEIAKDCNVKVSDIVVNYLFDLTCIHSNGSDERMYARQYFERTWVSWLNKED